LGEKSSRQKLSEEKDGGKVEATLHATIQEKYQPAHINFYLFPLPILLPLFFFSISTISPGLHF
jgi:hypothetical protein